MSDFVRSDGARAAIDAVAAELIGAPMESAPAPTPARSGRGPSRAVVTGPADVPNAMLTNSRAYDVALDELAANPGGMFARHDPKVQYARNMAHFAAQGLIAAPSGAGTGGKVGWRRTLSERVDGLDAGEFARLSDAVAAREAREFRVDSEEDEEPLTDEDLVGDLPGFDYVDDGELT